MKTFLAILFTFFLSAVAKAEGAFNFTALTDLIQKNNVSSVEGLIPLLPVSYRKNLVLMQKSNSLQVACSDHPRVILFGDSEVSDSITEGQNKDPLYIAFQTDTSTPSKCPKTSLNHPSRPENLEIIEWHYDRREYEFHDIEFDGKGSYHLGETKTCTGCHGNPPRPNWTAYPSWPGAVGDKDLNYTEPVKTYIEKLRAENPTLKDLDLSSFGNDDGYAPDDHSLTNMTSKVGDQLILRDTRLIVESQDFQKFKFAFTGAFLGCLNFSDFFPKSVLETLQSGALDQAAPSQGAPFQRMKELTAPLIQKYIHFSSYSVEVNITSWLRLLFEGRGQALFMRNLLGRPPRGLDSNWSYDLTSFGSRFGQGMAPRFFYEMKTDSSIGDLEQLARQSYEEASKLYLLGLEPKTNMELISGTCQALAAKSLQALQY